MQKRVHAMVMWSAVVMESEILVNIYRTITIKLDLRNQS